MILRTLTLKGQGKGKGQERKSQICRRCGYQMRRVGFHPFSKEEEEEEEEEDALGKREQSPSCVLSPLSMNEIQKLIPIRANRSRSGILLRRYEQRSQLVEYMFWVEWKSC